MGGYGAKGNPLYFIIQFCWEPKTSSLSAIRVVSSAYLRLLIFLLAILHMGQSPSWAVGRADEVLLGPPESKGPFLFAPALGLRRGSGGDRLG